MRLLSLGVAALASVSLLAACGTGSTPVATKQRTIIMVWDGLRPDSVNPTDTPNLYALRQAGVNFSDNHSTYPTFTMLNGSAFATGSFPKTSGFYGNTFWTPSQGSAGTIPSGISAGNGTADYTDPVFTEDYQILTTLNSYYGNQLLLVKSLFKTAQDAGLTTATVGKSGAAYIQDLGRNSYFLDENAVLPLSLAQELQAANYVLPANSPYAFSSGTLTLASGNGDPTARAGYTTFNLSNYGATIASRDAANTSTVPEDAANKYMLNVFTSYILPKKLPDLSLIWFRTPDNVEHGYGPGTAAARAGLASQDARLGELQAALKANGLDGSTNIVVVSDHGHSTVSGPTQYFPLRKIGAGTITGTTSTAAIGAIDDTNGYAFSGDVRVADMLTYQGFKAYDGNGCVASAMAGIKSDGTTVYTAVSDTGTLCPGASASKPQTYMAVSATLATPKASFKVPTTLPAGAVVVATNGGSDYFYVPDHNATTLTNLVTFLQSREEYGAIFVDSSLASTFGGSLPAGVLPMSTVNLENGTRRGNGMPDIIASFNWDAQQIVSGMAGTEFESMGGQRGMHGSFGPTDVHNTLIASGPGFRAGATVSTPTGNVDVAPTVAYLLGQSMPSADGRVINEALAKPASTATPQVASSVVNPTSAATGLSFKLPTDPTGATTDAARPLGTYSINLVVKDLTVDGKTYRYFDYAQAIRN